MYFKVENFNLFAMYTKHFILHLSKVLIPFADLPKSQISEIYLQKILKH